MPSHRFHFLPAWRASLAALCAGLVLGACATLDTGSGSESADGSPVSDTRELASTWDNDDFVYWGAWTDNTETPTTNPSGRIAAGPASRASATVIESTR
jgi:hypothetical protein